MAPVIWGLDLKEMQWGKFKSTYMFKNRDYHLRRTKFVVYQCALIFLVVSESLGTAVLSDYVDSQQFVEQRDPNVYVYNNDYVAVASYNIWAGVFTAFVFGAAFFFDLFWPARKENHGVRLAWKICGVLSCVFTCASAFALTIITAMNCGYFRGASYEYGESLLSQYTKDGGTPLCYRHDNRAIAAVVFVWPGFLSTVGSCILLFMSIDNTEKGPGPLSAHARSHDAADAEKQMSKDAPVVDDAAAHNAQPYSTMGLDGANETSLDAPPVAERAADTDAAAG